VVVVAGSGPIGMRSTTFTSFFTSFVRFPDCIVARVNEENAGSSENVAVGYFGLDWGLDSGQFAFADEGATP